MKITSIDLVSGQSIAVNDGVTAIVGPNNSGKSTLLRELHARLTAEPHMIPALTNKVVSGATLQYPATHQDLIAEIGQTLQLRPPGIYPEGQLGSSWFKVASGQPLITDQVPFLFGKNEGLGPLGHYFSLYLNAESRLQLTGDASSFDVLNALPSGPVQSMYSNRNLERTISDLTESAFGMKVYLNRFGGGVLRLHVGQMNTHEDSSPPSEAYLSELFALPPLSEQGDGVRAFVGMMLSIVSGRVPLVLIDEPEAFLHPPQARLLGEFLANQHSSGTQVVIATHSEDILTGLTSSRGGDASVVRITRDGNLNRVSQLESAMVRDLYSDPLIRYYDMLNGLFSTGIVLCEADGDCTYYRAVIDEPSTKQVATLRQAHITHAGGKSRIAQALAAFRAANVPSVSILDIDILQDESEFNKLARAAGLDPTTLASRRNSIVQAVESHATKPRRVSATAEIMEALDLSKATFLTNAQINAVRGAVTAVSGWKRLKTDGTSMLSGQAAMDMKSLSSELRAAGIFLVEVGELERWHPEVGQSDKALWLRSVIKARKHRRSGSKSMLRAIDQYLSS